MIRLFLKDLPYTLTQPMFREFGDKCRELNKWREHSRSDRVKKYLNQPEAIYFIFALGIYYRYVIAPFASSAIFVERLESKFDAGLKIGGKSFGPEFRKSIQAACVNFQGVMKTFRLEESFFAQTDIRCIVFALIELEERRENDNE